VGKQWFKMTPKWLVNGMISGWCFGTFFVTFHIGNNNPNNNPTNQIWMIIIAAYCMQKTDSIPLQLSGSSLKVRSAYFTDIRLECKSPPTAVPRQLAFFFPMILTGFVPKKPMKIP